MKKTFTLAIIFSISAIIQPAFCGALADQRIKHAVTSFNNKSIAIGSDRKTGELQLHFEADQPGEATITIADAGGNIVWQQTSQLKGCVNRIPLKQATSLAEGQYTVRLVAGSNRFSTTLMIWK
jgi:hypothetical protein